MTPIRPKMPTDADQHRSEMTAARYLILTEQHDEVVDDWRKAHLGEEVNAAWGPSDLSSNPIAESCHQLSTPGLYGGQPTIRNSRGGADALIGDDGELRRCGYWTRMQWVQFLTLGMGDEVVLFDVALHDVVDDAGAPSKTAELVHRLAHPFDVWTEPDEDRPDRVTGLAVLRLQYDPVVRKHIYVWRRYLLPTATREASFAIVEAHPGGGFGDDLSDRLLLRPDGTYGPLIGEAYPYRWPDGPLRGQAFIPAVVYRSADTGQSWNYLLKRGAHHGTLNSALYYSFAGHTARSASGSMVLLVGGSIKGAQTVRQPDSDPPRAPQSLAVLPGSIVEVHPHDPQTPVQVHEIGPGGNLEAVTNWARDYSLQQLVRAGLNPADISRQHANPTSGAALAISNAEKRQAMAQVEETFRRVDLEAIAKAAAMLRLFGGERYATLPVDGYTITYASIPESPSEAQERRDDIDWRVEHGHLSEVDAFCLRNPGASREDAIDAITRARVDRAMLDAAYREGLAAAGLREPEPPPTPAPAGGAPPPPREPINDPHHMETQ